MKILLINKDIHHKNLNIIKLYKHIDFEQVNEVSDIESYDLTLFDCVFSPSEPIDVSKYSGTCFIFGPHFSVFPNEKLLKIKSKNTAFVILSEWVKKIWQSYNICDNLNLIDIPFPVDTEKFNEVKPIQNRNLVFIYYKSRHPQELNFIENILQQFNISYKIFSYKHRYNENDYLEYLQNSRFGVWVDAHESQGFALEEALSCNVPLFVWNIKSMNQEYGQNHPDIPATTIPYWDERCGEYFYDMTDFRDKFNKFFNNLESYKPREYVLENLSPEVCEKAFINMILELKDN
jgi:hypothetical protein